MASWRNEYAQALLERDEREKENYQRVDAELIEAFTHLLDHTAALEAEKEAHAHSTTTTPSTKGGPAPAASIDGNAQLRSDLAEALRSNGQLQSRIKATEGELIKLRAKTKTDSRAVEDLTKERTYLRRKIKDKDEEVRGKTKLLDDVHDEIVSLNIQLNMSEQKNEKLVRENKELIDRWMASKRQEAEHMNDTLQGTGR